MLNLSNYQVIVKYIYPIAKFYATYSKIKPKHKVACFKLKDYPALYPHLFQTLFLFLKREFS